MAKLYTLLKASETQIRKIISKELKMNGYAPLVENDFIFAEGSIPVLLVAHYDTVPNPPRFITNKDGVLSGKKGLGADDRAGIYAILELIRKHHCNVLFTGGEECGCIGAKAFTKSGIKLEVNYIIELDRRGENDAVYYDGESEEFEKFIDSFGWKTAIGSCTDICEVAPYLDVMGVNLSIGYAKEHTENETLDTNIMNRTIERVSKMLDGPRFEWHETAHLYDYSRYTYGYGYGYDGYDTYEWYIEYTDKDGNDCASIALGWSKAEAIGNFLMEHSDLTYSSILGVYDDYLDEDISYNKEKGEEKDEQNTNIIYNQQKRADSFDLAEWLDKGN